jgi:hypothetical protein
LKDLAMSILLLIASLGGFNQPSIMQMSNRREFCFTPERRSVDLKKLELRVGSTVKANAKYFTIVEEKVWISDAPNEKYRIGTEIYNISAIIHADYEKSTFLFHGKMGKDRYIYWGNTGYNDGDYRFGLFKIVGSSLVQYCSNVQAAAQR